MAGSTALVRGDKHFQAVVEGDRTLPGEGLGAEEVVAQDGVEVGDRQQEDTLITLSGRRMPNSSR